MVVEGGVKLIFLMFLASQFVSSLMVAGAGMMPTVLMLLA